MEQWSNGAMEQWSNGAMEQWSNGVMEHFIACTSTLRYADAFLLLV
jgi:hypothetical protein